MPDIDKLVTRLPNDKGYNGESPAKEGLPGFVCPRADAYGGRAGIIPPGVAAVNGLVPRGMTRIAVSDTARRANEARVDGKTEAERYMEYYAKAAAEQEGQAERSRPTRPARTVQSGGPATDTAPKPPASPVPPAGHSVVVEAARSGGRVVPGAGVRLRRFYPRDPAPNGRPDRNGRRDGQVIRDPDDPGMFSREMGQGRDADTLDSFYDGLAGESPGTGETDIRDQKRGYEAGMDVGAGRGETVVGAVRPGPPRTHEPLGRGSTELDAWADAMSKMAEEKAALGQAVAALEAKVTELERERSDAEERDRHYAAIEEGLAKAVAPAETVRVALAVPEERLKVGGAGERREERWECRVMGALHVGRGGRSAVLTLSDPSYAADLLADMQAGKVVVLSESKRTYCTYNGHCAKIYAEPDSQDFITAFWLSVDGSDDAA